MADAQGKPNERPLAPASDSATRGYRPPEPPSSTPDRRNSTEKLLEKLSETIREQTETLRKISKSRKEAEVEEKASTKRLGKIKDETSEEYQTELQKQKKFRAEIEALNAREKQVGQENITAKEAFEGTIKDLTAQLQGYTDIIGGANAAVNTFTKSTVQAAAEGKASFKGLTEMMRKERDLANQASAISRRKDAGGTTFSALSDLIIITRTLQTSITNSVKTLLGEIEKITKNTSQMRDGLSLVNDHLFTFSQHIDKLSGVVTPPPSFPGIGFLAGAAVASASHSAVTDPAAGAAVASASHSAVTDPALFEQVEAINKNTSTIKTMMEDIRKMMEDVVSSGRRRVEVLEQIAEKLGQSYEAERKLEAARREEAMEAQTIYPSWVKGLLAKADILKETIKNSIPNSQSRLLKLLFIGLVGVIGTAVGYVLDKFKRMSGLFRLNSIFRWVFGNRLQLSIIGSTMAKLAKWGKAIGSVIMKLLPGIGKILVKAFGVGFKIFTKIPVIGWAIDAVLAIIDIVRVFRREGGVMGIVKGIMVAIIRFLTLGFVDFEKALKLATNIVEWFKNFIPNIKKLWKLFKELVPVIWKNAKEKLAEWFGDALLWVGKTLDKVYAAVWGWVTKDLPAAAIKAFDFVGNFLATSMKSGWESLTNWIWDKFKELWDGIRSSSIGQWIFGDLPADTEQGKAIGVSGGTGAIAGASRGSSVASFGVVQSYENLQNLVKTGSLNNLSDDELRRARDESKRLVDNSTLTPAMSAKSKELHAAIEAAYKARPDARLGKAPISNPIPENALQVNQARMQAREKANQTPYNNQQAPRVMNNTTLMNRSTNTTQVSGYGSRFNNEPTVRGVQISCLPGNI